MHNQILFAYMKVFLVYKIRIFTHGKEPFSGITNHIDELESKKCDFFSSLSPRATSKNLKPNNLNGITTNQRFFGSNMSKCFN